MAVNIVSYENLFIPKQITTTGNISVISTDTTIGFTVPTILVTGSTYNDVTVSESTPRIFAVNVGNKGGTDSVVINYESNGDNTNASRTTYGAHAGMTNQGVGAVALGDSAGKVNQGAGAVAIGQNSGLNDQGAGSVSIGYNCGMDTSMPANSIAIGNACHAPGAVGRLGFGNNLESLATSASVGSNGAVPAQVAGYLIFEHNGTPYKCALFNM